MDYSDIDKNKENKNEENKNIDNQKEEELDPEKKKELIDTNDFGFTRIKTFEQLKGKVLEIKRDYEKTKIDVIENTANINIISNKLEDIIEEGEEGEKEGGKEGRKEGGKKWGKKGGKKGETIEDSNNNINNQISDMNKKLKFLLGNISLEDIENYDNEDDNSQNKKKLMNFEEMNRKIVKLQFTKVDNVELDLKNERVTNKIDDVERKLNELIFGLYGDFELYNIDDPNHKKITFVIKEEFDEYKSNTEEEFCKISKEIDKLKRITEKIFDHLKEKASLKDLDDVKNYLLQKVEELFMGLSKKFVERHENAIAFKNLEDQFKKIIVLLASKVEHEKDNWLLAKKPINGFSCAACESYIGELKEEQNNKYIPWNKMPLREREKEQEKEKEKVYRLGNGYSKVLKMVGVDNNGNVTLNPSSDNEVNSLFAGNNDTSKTKEGFDLQINKTGLERIQSAHSKEKTIDVIRIKKYNDRKLPKLKGAMSTDNFDKIIENPNPTMNFINISGNSSTFINPKITKIMKKTQNKFNL